MFVDAVGHVLGGKYRIVRLLGAGGMGSVYEGVDTVLDRRLALKVLHPHLAQRPELVARFLREARATARLQHPNLVAVTDAGPTALLEGKPSSEPAYLVMEYLEGRSLAQEIESAPLSPLRTAAVAAQALAALGVAHTAHIVHRDIKPDNLFLTAFAGGDLVKVLDFGIAKLRDEAGDKLTATGAMLGSPAYMSPEQARGEEVDERTDIYGVGVCMYHALTGRLPFDGASVPQMMVSILRDTPAPISSIRREVPLSLARIVERAMAKDRTGRFVSADQMRSALEQFVAGEDVSVVSATVSADANAGIALAPTQDGSERAPTPPAYVPAASEPPAATMPEAGKVRPSRGLSPWIVGMICCTAIIIAVVSKVSPSRPTGKVDPVITPSSSIAASAQLAAPSASLGLADPMVPATVIPGAATVTEKSPSPSALASAQKAFVPSKTADPTAADQRAPLQPLAGGASLPPSAKPTGGTKPRIGSIDANGAYDLDLVKAVLASALPAVTECYVKAQYDAVDHGFVYWLIRTDRATGKVAGVGGVGSAERSPYLDHCVAAALKTLTFGPMPKPNKGYEHDAGDIKIMYSAEVR